MKKPSSNILMVYAKDKSYRVSGISLVSDDGSRVAEPEGLFIFVEGALIPHICSFIEAPRVLQIPKDVHLFRQTLFETRYNSA